MIKEVLLVLVLKKITNMTRDQGPVSETVRVTTAVASIQSVSTTNALHVVKTSTSTLLPRNARLTHAQSKVFVAVISVLMIKEVLLVLVLKKITNMTRDQGPVSETVRVTTAVASIQSVSTTNALHVVKTSTSTLLPRNAILTHAQSKVF